MEDEKIPTRQLFGILIISRLSFSISNIIALHIPPYNQDQWITVIVSGVYVIVASIPLLFLANKLNNNTVRDFMQKLYGETLCIILGLFHVVYFIIQTVNILVLQSELVTSSILPESSNLLIITLMITTCIYLTSRGVHIILRAVDLLIPLIYLILISLILLGFNNIDFSLFLPILSDTPFIELNRGAIMLASMYNDIIIIAMFVPELEDNKAATKLFLGTLTANVVILIIVVIVTMGSLGVEYSRHSIFPFLVYVKLIDAANFIERIAALFVIMWLIAVTSRINILLYLSTKILRDVFKKGKDDRLMLFIVSAIIWTIAIFIAMMRPVVGTREDLNVYLAIFFVIFIIVFPIITCVVYFFKRKSINGTDD